MTEAMSIAIIGVCGSLAAAIVPKLIDHYFGIGKDIAEIKKDVKSLTENDKMNGDMIYQMLDHMSTNNNSGEMKRALDEYNAYQRHSK